MQINIKNTGVYIYFRNRYPEATSHMLVGSINCIFRTYTEELGCMGKTSPSDISSETFFKVLASKSDAELIQIRNLGKNKLKFLRNAQNNYENEQLELPENKFKYMTKFNTIIDEWVRVKNHCRTTDNKDFTDNEPSDEWKSKLLISEHSPIRLIEIDWTWEDIYSWVATHWSRHKFEKFISTQRDDRKAHDIPRGKMPQDTPVKFDGYANMQSLIDSFRKRLCYQASPETRELAEDFKMALHETRPVLADVLVPNCIYRCGCPEFKTCGYFNAFVNKFRKGFAEYDIVALNDIQTRYNIYNEIFEEKQEEKHENKSDD